MASVKITIAASLDAVVAIRDGTDADAAVEAIATTTKAIIEADRIEAFGTTEARSATTKRITGKEIIIHHYDCTQRSVEIGSSQSTSDLKTLSLAPGPAATHAQRSGDAARRITLLQYGIKEGEIVQLIPHGILVRSVQGSSRAMKADSLTTVDYLESELSKCTSWPVKDQRLTHAGRYPRNGKTLSEVRVFLESLYPYHVQYRIGDGETIYLITQDRGS